MAVNYKKLYENADRERRYAWCVAFNTRAMINEMCDHIADIEKSDMVDDMPIHLTNMILDLSNKAKEMIECPICLDTVTVSGDTKITKCGHIYHKKCLAMVENKLCPICRKNIG